MRERRDRRRHGLGRLRRRQHRDPAGRRSSRRERAACDAATRPLPALEGSRAVLRLLQGAASSASSAAADCGAWRHVPREMCARLRLRRVGTGSARAGAAASSRGPSRAARCTPRSPTDRPYAPVVVEMDEGVRLVTEVVDCAPDDLAIGHARRGRLRRRHPRGDASQVPQARVVTPILRTRMETRALQLPPTILFEKRDHIAIVTINRPDAMNALTKEMLLGIDRRVRRDRSRSRAVGLDPDRRGRPGVLLRDGPEGRHPRPDGRRLARLRRPDQAAVQRRLQADHRGRQRSVYRGRPRDAARHRPAHRRRERALRSRRGALGTRPGRRLARAAPAAGAVGDRDAAAAHRRTDRREARLRGRAS